MFVSIHILPYSYPSSKLQIDKAGDKVLLSDKYQVNLSMYRKVTLYYWSIFQYHLYYIYNL